MKLSKINLNNPLIRNYKNINTPPTDSTHNSTKNQQHLLKPNYVSCKLKSFNTIDICLNKPQQSYKLLSQQNIKDTYKSKSGSKTKSISLSIQQNQQTETKINSKRSIRNHLNQILIQIEPQTTKTNSTIKKVKQYYTGSSLGSIPKQEYSKQYKRQQNQQIPNFIKIHLEKDIYENKLLVEYNSKQSIEQIKAKKKAKLLLPPLPNNRKQKERGKQDQEKNANGGVNFEPYITEYKLIEPRNKSRDNKIKNSQRYLSQQKSKRIVCPKYSLENIVMNADICGWEPQQQ